MGISDKADEECLRLDRIYESHKYKVLTGEYSKETKGIMLKRLERTFRHRVAEVLKNDK